MSVPSTKAQRRVGLRSFLGIVVFLAFAGVVAVDAWQRTDAVDDVIVIGFARGIQPGPGFATKAAEIARRLQLDEGLIVELEGHTGTIGDTAANQTLALERAQAVKAELIGLGIAGGRVAVSAAGGTEPLEKRDGEAERAYQRRLARVEAMFKAERGG
ncbi:OmpA family protein [Labrenzia sp. VG12]|uniref:OmpA family protein n=1 Tax=Labrenzia sp. VG12 TaxID=2021862 RepID=UPI0012FDCA90|nr:OmpA family protein [Labrenzia sp. VG12]